MKYWQGLAVFALVAAGCGKKDDVVTTPNGTATVEGNGDKATVRYQGKGDSATATVDKAGGTKIDYKNDKGEKATFDNKAGIDPKELGVELYPGATRLQGAGDSAKLETDKGINLTIRLSTTDKAQAVGEFYKKQIKDATVMPMGETVMVSGKNAAGDDVVVTADPTKKKGTTEISVMVNKKK